MYQARLFQSGEGGLIFKKNNSMAQKNTILERVSQQIANGSLFEIKMDGVAQEMGVSKKTLYKMFGSKKAMLDEALHFYLNKTVQRIEVAAKGRGSVKRRILQAEIIAFDALHGLFPHQWQFFDDKAKKNVTEEYIKKEKSWIN